MEMIESTSSAQMWEDGCRSDPLRNTFIIPEIVRVLNDRRPGIILDIGAGTGYISREIDKLLTYRAKWKLIDIDAERLQIASDLKPASMNQDVILSDIFNIRPKIEKCDAAILTFTLLEIEHPEKCIFTVERYLSKNAIIIIAIPDCWNDVWKQSEIQKELFTEFLKGSATLQKVDKFTNAPYPFRALRVERIIEFTLDAGFELFEMCFNKDQTSPTYILCFRRST